MTTINKDNLALIKNLSPEKQALMMKALMQEAVESQKTSIIPRSTRREPIPLSFPQQRLWMLDQLQLGSSAYNELSALRLVGALNVPMLERSLNEIVRRHEVLRTTFSTVDGKPVQVIAPAQTATLITSDLRRLPEAEQEAEIQRLADNEALHSFDLARGPLLRVSLLRLGEQQNILLVTAHHIVLDGWSIGVFGYELAELYKAFCAEQPSPLPELPIQYADFAIWQRQRLQEDALKTQLNYWTEQLNDLPPLLQLPVANPRPEIETFRGARQRFNLGSQLSKELRALSHRENVTLFMTLLASFQTLLYRYSNQTDMPIGTVIANRNQAEIERLIGFFVNTLVLRTDLSGDPSFRQLMQRVSGVAVAAYENQELPFEFLVDALQPERSLSYNPLFQVMFILQNTPKQTVELPGLTLTPMELNSVTAKFDLTLSMEQTPQGLQGVWEYNSDLFEAATVSRMSGHMVTLLEAIASDPDHHVAGLPLLSAPERQQMLVEWNRTLASYPADRCVHQLFEAQAAQSPEATAVASAGESISYGELNRRANRLANRLRGLGVKEEVLVGVCLRRSIEMVVGLLGVLKAGGGYVPMDVSYPRQRKEYMAEDAGVRVVITRRGEWEYAVGGVEVVYADDESEETSKKWEENPVSGVASENLAYVIYTSGSTGKPKGVLVSHKNLVHSTTARWNYYRQPVTSFLLLSSFAFDSSIAGIFWTLTQGGTLVLPSDDISLDIAQLCQLIASNQVSHLLSIPSVYDLILQHEQPQQLASLQTVIVAGEPCPTRVIERHTQLLEHADIFNEYGPTEATVWTSVYRCEPKQLKTPIPIGRPITNTQIYLLDSNLQPVPVGVPAELHVGGDGVTRGYLNHPQLTAEKFIPQPLTDVADTRLYKTGDLARYLPDGNIELLGRVDHQVKIRGFRIELGEIEAALLQHPAVRESVVTVREDEQENKRLVSYLAVNDDATVSLNELRNFLLEQLPAYAVPSEYVLLDALPRLPNGKVDRNTLPAPENSRPEIEAPDVADWTDLELMLADIWQETLDIEAVGRNDNFFQIGGDSLSIIRVYNRLRTMIDKDVAITDLFKNSTISSLAEFLSR